MVGPGLRVLAALWVEAQIQRTVAWIGRLGRGLVRPARVVAGAVTVRRALVGDALRIGERPAGRGRSLLATSAGITLLALRSLRAFGPRRSGFALRAGRPWLAVGSCRAGLSGLSGWARFPSSVGAV